VEEAAVAVDGDHTAAGNADLGAESRREAITEGPLVAGGQISAGSVDREERSRPVTDLGALLDEDAVVRQLGPDCQREVRLGPGLRPFLHELRFEGRQLFPARRAGPVVTLRPFRQLAQPEGSISDESDVRLVVAADLCRVDIELNNGFLPG